MQTIDDTPIAQRFLMVAHRLSTKAWRNECNAVTAWLNSQPETLAELERDAMMAIIQKPLSEKEHVFVIVHCYADISEGTTWNIAFDPNATGNHEPTIATLRFGVIWHRAVSPFLVHGWHQVAVIDFPNGLPRILESLPVDPKTEQSNYTCLCAASDFHEIKRCIAGMAGYTNK